MKLVIVESPTKAKTISQYLDSSYEVRPSVGHIRDLPKSNKKAIDIKGGFVPHYEISKGKAEIVAELQHLAKQADEVILATDPDREGEAIAWHIKEACDLKNPKRVVFHEITKSAILEAFEHPREIDENLRKAQEARRVLFHKLLRRRPRERNEVLLSETAGRNDSRAERGHGAFGPAPRSRRERLPQLDLHG